MSYYGKAPRDQNDKAAAIRRRRELVMRDEEEANEMMMAQKKTVQAKLEISEPGDVHEQQADAVAKNVSEGKNASSILTQQLSPAPSAQTKSEGESLQGTETLQRSLDSSKSSGQSLPENVQQDIGGKMGADLSDVKIHTGSNAHEMSEGINAKAFTHGQDIYFKNGNYNPESSDGKNLLAHELTHTVQQGDGKVQPKIQRTAVNPEEKKQEFTKLKTPLKATAKMDGVKLLSDTIAGAGSEATLKEGDELALLYEDTKKEAWYFARLNGSEAAGYIGKNDVLISEATVELPGAVVANDEVVVDKKVVETTEGTEDKEKKKETKEKQDDKKDKKDKKEKKGEGDKKIENAKIQTNDPILGEKLTLRKKNRGKKLGVAEELSRFRTDAAMLETEAEFAIKEQIEQLALAANGAKLKVTTDAAIKRAETEAFYIAATAAVNADITRVTNEAALLKMKEERRIRKSQEDQVARLEKETAGEVKRMEEEGEKLAVEAEQHAVIEEKRIRKEEKRQEISLHAWTKSQIEHYIRVWEAEGRRDRMQTNLGEMRDDAIEGIKENNDDLIESIYEDAADLAERMREEYAEAAESLPEGKEEVVENINSLADQAVAELDKVSTEPLATFNAGGQTLLTQLEIQKAAVLAHIDGLVEHALGEITADQEKRIQDLKKILADYKLQSQQVVAAVEGKIGTIPDEMVIELIYKSEDLLDESMSQLKDNIAGGVATKKQMYDLTASTVIGHITDQRNATEIATQKSSGDFKKSADEILMQMTDIYVSASAKGMTGIKDVVDQFIAGIHKTADDSLTAMREELAEGKNEITEKADEVLAENEEMYLDMKEEITEEAEQLASEYEVTYWARALLSVIGDIIMAVVKIIAAIIAIIIAIILLVLAVIALILLIVALIEALVALVVFLVGVIVDLVITGLLWLAEGGLTTLMWGLRFALERFLTVNLPAFFSAFSAAMAPYAPLFEAWLIADIIMGSGKIIYSYMPWVSAEEARVLRIEGTIQISFGLLGKWEAIWKIFQASPAFIRSLKFWNRPAAVTEQQLVQQGLKTEQRAVQQELTAETTQRLTGAQLAKKRGLPDAQEGYKWVNMRTKTGEDLLVYQRKYGHAGPERYYDETARVFKDVPLKPVVSKLKPLPIAQGYERASLGSSTTTSYKKTFSNAFPETEGKVWVHHAVEQDVLKLYPGVITKSEMHSLQNLRGIPNALNADIHLSKIRIEWNQFYKSFPNATKQQILDKVTQIDNKFGHLFYPPIR